MTTAATPGLVLALDQGGQGSRAALYELDGTRVGEAHVPVATRRTDGVVEHDPHELLDSVRQAVRDVAMLPAAGGRSIVAAGLATQRSTVVCWERATAHPIGAALSWQDRRNADWLEHLRPLEPEIRRITGLVLSPHYGAGKLRWCLDHLPGVRSAAARGDLAAGPLASWLTQALLVDAPCVADPSNASRTLLFDPRTLDWSDALLAAFGIDRAWLPRCVPTRHDYGHLAVAGRRVPLTACTGDQSAAAFAGGRPDPAVAFVNAGTGAFIQRALDATVALPDGMLQSVLRSGADGAVYSLEGTVNGAASAVAWLGERVALDVRRALATLTVPAGTDVPVFVNGVGGLGSPWWRADFPVEFVGGGGDHERLAAVVESVAFMLAANLEAMRRAAPLTGIRLSGGLANCDHLCRALAAVTGLVVERSEDTEATARGIAFLAAGEPAGWRPAGIDRRWLPERDPALEARHDRWRGEMSKRGAPA